MWAQASLSALGAYVTMKFVDDDRSCSADEGGDRLAAAPLLGGLGGCFSRRHARYDVTTVSHAAS
jgi:hypothetical protein